MKYKEYIAYLVEGDAGSSYRKKIGLVEAIDIYLTKCAESRHINIYRGDNESGFGECNIVHGEKGQRYSKHTTNHYTVILDQLIKEHGNQYPLRSASVIASMHTGKAGMYATRSGGLYNIIPYNDVIVATLPVDDIWHVELVNGKKLNEINKVFDSLGIEDDSLQNIAKQIEALSEKDFKKVDWLFKGGQKNIEQQIRKLYALDNVGVKFVKAKDYSNSRYDGEVWIGGECLMIEHSLYENVVSKITSKNYIIVNKTDDFDIHSYADEFTSVDMESDDVIKKNHYMSVVNLDKLNIQQMKYRYGDEVDATEFTKYLMQYMNPKYRKEVMDMIISAIDGDDDKYEIPVILNAFTAEFDHYFKHFDVDGFVFEDEHGVKRYILKKKVLNYNPNREIW